MEVPVTIACYGDSTIYGLTALSDGSFARVSMPAPAALEVLLQMRIPDLAVQNHGVSGTTAADWLAGTTGVPLPWKAEMKLSRADWVLICVGINDDPNGFQDRYEQMVSIAVSAGKRVIIQTPNALDIPWGDITPKVEAERAVHENWPRTVLVDFYAYTQKMGDEWKTCLSYSEMFGARSGIHPTQAGYDVMASIERDVLLPILCGSSE